MTFPYRILIIRCRTLPYEAQDNHVDRGRDCQVGGLAVRHRPVQEQIAWFRILRKSNQGRKDCLGECAANSYRTGNFIFLISEERLVTSMVTDISPIFGLTLLELVEWVTIMAPVISAMAVGALLLIHYRQHGLQQRLISAQLSLKMLEHWEDDKHKNFADFMERVANSEVEEDNPYIGNYLSVWEEIAVLCNEGTITKNHRKEFFEPDLKAMHDNTVVCGYLKKKHTKTTYHNLWKLMEKTCSS